MRATDKTSELEKQVSSLRAKYSTLRSSVMAKGVRVERLATLRTPLRELCASASNSMLCSVLYSENSFRSQLTRVQAAICELAAYNEELIEQRFRPLETASARSSRLRRLGEEIPLKADEVRDGYSGFHDGKAMVPVYYLAYKNVTDVAGFLHADYRIWLKSGKEFSTGFVGYPTAHNWQTVATQRELLAALTTTLTEDGLL